MLFAFFAGQILQLLDPSAVQDHTIRAHLRLQTPSSPALALQLIGQRHTGASGSFLTGRGGAPPPVLRVARGALHQRVGRGADPSAGRVWYSHRPCRAGRCFRRSTSRCLLRSEWHPARPATTGVSAVHHGGDSCVALEGSGDQNWVLSRDVPWFSRKIIK